MLGDKQKPLIIWAIAILSLAAYIGISYFIQRHESFRLISIYILLFGSYGFLYKYINTASEVNTGYFLGIIFRLSLISLIPNLSDDVYRFIWDGRLLANGINPFTHTPSFFLEKGTYSGKGLDPSLFSMFGKDTYSSYPPLNQLIFFLAAKISPGSVYGSILIIRGCILIFEVGNIFLIRKLLKVYGISLKRGLLYVLNPLIILELTGNLHFEALMIFFLFLTLLWIKQSNIMLPAASFAMAVISKLIPLIFLPVLWYRLGSKKGFTFTAFSGLFILLSFLPFFDLNIIMGIFKSLSLYFHWFEFNASFYYLIREIGYLITGFNIIWVAGPLLGLITLFLIFRLSFTKYARTATIPEISMWLLMIYLALATTLHPWYITTLAALSLFTPYRFPLVWTFFIFLSYAGYTEDGFQENYWLTGIEYLVVYGIMVWELIVKKKKHQVLPTQLKE